MNSYIIIIAGMVGFALIICIVLMTRYDTKKDRCVICGRETKYYPYTNIHLRDCYIEGCGQLCDECFISIYDLKSEKDERGLRLNEGKDLVFGSYNYSKGNSKNITQIAQLN